MGILAYGSIKLFPGNVCICSSFQAVEALPVLFRLGIWFEINFGIPKVISCDESFLLAQAKGWGKVEREEVARPYELKLNEAGIKLREFCKNWPIVPFTQKDLEIIGSPYVIGNGYKLKAFGSYGAENE